MFESCKGLLCFIIPKELIFLEELSEGPSNATIIVEKFVIVAGETQKSSQDLQGLWLRPILHCLDLFGVHPDTFTAHNVAQILNFFHAKSALGHLDK